MTKSMWIQAVLLSVFLAFGVGCGDDTASGSNPGPEKPEPKPEPEPEPEPELAAPVITVSVPAAGATLEWGVVRVEGSVVAEAGLDGLTWALNDGEAVKVETTGDATNASFAFDVEPGAGAHVLEFLAVDAEGQEATASVSFEVGEEPDRTLPVIEVVTPIPGTFTTVRQVLVTGRATDDRGVVHASWSLNDGAANEIAVDEAGQFAFTVAPALGANVLSIMVLDEEENEVGAEIPFHFGNFAAAGAQHSGAVVDGRLYTWGGNANGQLGLGPEVTAEQYEPVHVASLENVASVLFNQNSSAAILFDGSVWTWGRNGSGQLGVGTSEAPDTTDRSEPTRVALDGVASAGVGFDHILFLRADGTVYASGDNDDGQLGDGTVADSSFPVQVQGLADVIKVVAGSAHSVALRADGTVWVWGRNSQGNLGQGTEDAEPHGVPVQVPDLVDVVDVAAGRDHTLAVRADGSVMAWGLNRDGQVGNGESGTGLVATSPTAVLGLEDAVAVFAGGNMSFAIKADGSAIGWGDNFLAQLATGDSTDRTSPEVPVKDLTGLVGLGVGATHVIAADDASNVFGWGWSFKGSLGRADAADRWAYPEPLVIFADGELPAGEP